VRRETGRGEDRLKIWDLLAEARCSQSVLGFLSTTDVGRQVPAAAGEEAQSEASEWELRERRGREEEMKQETEELDAEAERPLFLPTPSFMASAEGECRRFSFVIPFCLFVLLPPLLFPWRALSFLGQAQAEGKGEPAASRLCADSRREPVKFTPP